LKGLKINRNRNRNNKISLASSPKRMKIVSKMANKAMRNKTKKVNSLKIPSKAITLNKAIQSPKLLNNKAKQKKNSRKNKKQNSRKPTKLRPKNKKQSKSNKPCKKAKKS
jgi:hypothetical protein